MNSRPVAEPGRAGDCAGGAGDERGLDRLSPGRLIAGWQRDRCLQTARRAPGAACAECQGSLAGNAVAAGQRQRERTLRCWLIGAPLRPLHSASRTCIAPSGVSARVGSMRRAIQALSQRVGAVAALEAGQPSTSAAAVQFGRALSTAAVARAVHPEEEASDNWMG